VLNLDVLWGRVGTRHPKLDTVREEEGAGGVVVKLTSLLHWTLRMVQPNCVDI
jgi:hypothetical protein